MPLTPYEFGRETGRLQAAIHPDICIEQAQHLAHMLGIEGDQQDEYMEGYSNGFTEEKQRRQLVQEGTDAWLALADQMPDQEQEPEYIPSAAELDELEESL